jgi:hypothetical protein
MNYSIDAAFERLNALESELRAGLKAGQNEADTRLKVLDRVLFEVLGWKHDPVLVEPSCVTCLIRCVTKASIASTGWSQSYVSSSRANCRAVLP